MSEEERKLLLLVAKNLIYSNNASGREFLDYDDKRDIKNLIEKIENKYGGESMNNTEKCIAIFNHTQDAMGIANELGNAKIFSLLLETGYKIADILDKGES